jgi:hypothetical protein
VALKGALWQVEFAVRAENWQNDKRLDDSCDEDR